MKLGITILGAALAAIVSLSGAQATTLTGTATVDNAFSAWLSTDDSTLGTFVGGGSDWQSATNLGSTPLAAGTTYFLHIVAFNENGLPATPGADPDAFLGAFHLDSTDHQFANGTQDLLTNTLLGWASSAVTATSLANAESQWGAPSGTLQSFGANSDPTIWFGAHGLFAAIAANADWVWSSNDLTGAAFFSAQISATTPIPAALPLLATALGGLGFAGWRRRKASAAA
jgi:hypothetical protein